jgi:thioredoxin 1
MATVTLTTENFDETILTNDVVFLDFWAGWCGPCRMFAPTYDKVSEEFPGIIFGKVDTEAQQDLAAAFQIQSIPTLMAIREQVVLFQQAGAMPEEAFRDLVTKVMALDMAEIHADIAKENGEDETV